MEAGSDARPQRVALRANFLTGDLADLPQVRLAGSRCNACGIALFGERHRCENCASADLAHMAFASTGRVFTYTVQRYPPPPPHALPEPWTPRPIAWIDLDEKGPRILAAVRCAPEDISIGMPVRLDCWIGWSDDSGNDVVAFDFLPDGEAR